MKVRLKSREFLVAGALLLAAAGFLFYHGRSSSLPEVQTTTVLRGYREDRFRHGVAERRQHGERRGSRSRAR